MMRDIILHSPRYVEARLSWIRDDEFRVSDARHVAAAGGALKSELPDFTAITTRWCANQTSRHPPSMTAFTFGERLFKTIDL